MPEVSELAKETSLMFVNQHFSLSGAKPLSPSVIELGGIHIQKAKTIEAVSLNTLLFSKILHKTKGFLFYYLFIFLVLTTVIRFCRTWCHLY